MAELLIVVLVYCLGVVATAYVAGCLDRVSGLDDAAGMRWQVAVLIAIWPVTVAFMVSMLLFAAACETVTRIYNLGRGAD